MEKNILIKIEYDGKNFSGWQRQGEIRTVQGVLEEALSKFTDTEITLNGTSRTDAGVHALGQCASFKADFSIPLDKLQFAVNNYLAGGMNKLNPVGDIRIIDIKEMPMDFHARFDCKGKTYRYIVANGTPSAFRKDYAYYVPYKLDYEKMVSASKHLIGTHDFKAFQSQGSIERETTVRTIHAIDIKKTENCDIIIEVTGDGFLYNMVRIIVGTLVDVGTGKFEPEYVKEIVESMDRSKAGHTAPPNGLYLKEIYY